MMVIKVKHCMIKSTFQTPWVTSISLSFWWRLLRRYKSKAYYIKDWHIESFINGMKWDSIIDKLKNYYAQSQVWWRILKNYNQLYQHWMMKGRDWKIAFYRNTALISFTFRIQNWISMFNRIKLRARLKYHPKNRNQHLKGVIVMKVQKNNSNLIMIETIRIIQ